MKIILYILLSLLFRGFSFAQEPFCNIGANEPASFRGGKEAIYKYLADHLVYPESLKNNTEAKCKVRFMIDTSGNVKNAILTQKAAECPECDAEALRVISSMPQWNPGKYLGKPENSYYEIPINFSAPKITPTSKTSESAKELPVCPNTNPKIDSSLYIFDFDNPELPAEFPGGHTALRNYLSKNLKVPRSCEPLNFKCYLRFEIDIDGSVNNVVIMKRMNECPDCENEAIRVIKAMPKWIPSTLNGKPIKSFYDMPFNFP